MRYSFKITGWGAGSVNSLVVLIRSYIFHMFRIILCRCFQYGFVISKRGASGHRYPGNDLLGSFQRGKAPALSGGAAAYASSDMFKSDVRLDAWSYGLIVL